MTDHAIFLQGPNEYLVIVDDDNGQVLEVVTQGPQGIPGRLLRPPIKVDYAATIDINCSIGDTFDLVLLGNTTITMSNAMDGQRILLRATQDSVGNRIITWGAMVKFGADLLYLPLSTTPNKTDYIGVIYRDAISTFELIGFARGY